MPTSKKRAAAGRHRGRDADELLVAAGKVDEDLAEDVLIAVCLVGAADALARLGVETARGVPDGRILHRGPVTHALLGDDMEDAGAFEVANLAEGPDDFLDIVAVDGTEVAEAERLEDRTARAADEIRFRAPDLSLDPAAQAAFAHDVPDLVLDAVVGPARRNPQQVVVDGAEVPVDGDVVVVEDDEDVSVAGAGVVEAFPGQAAGHGAVADHGHCLVLPALHPGAHGKAQGGGDGGRAVADAESVVGALVPAREAADAAFRALGPEGILASGQDLVGVGLVPDVEDNFVRGRIIYIM